MLNVEANRKPETAVSTANELLPVKRHCPGESGIWLFVLLDMCMFTAMFGSFAYYRATEFEIFNVSQATLDKNLGAINTVLLLASSWFVFVAIQAAKQGRRAIVLRCLPLAFLCGLGFIFVKRFEYADKLAHGHTLMANNFYNMYYIMTGIHLTHLIAGMGVLIYMFLRAKRSAVYNADDIVFFETGATFWHMVDLLWIVLFALLYIFK